MKEKLKKIADALWTLVNSRVFYYIVIVVLVIFAVRQCGNRHNQEVENTILNQNLAAKTDTIKSYKNKNNELVSEKAIYIKSIKRLKDENSSLYRRVQSQKGDIITLNRTVVTLKQNASILSDSIRYLTSIIDSAKQIDSANWVLPWTLSYRWDSVNHDIFKGNTFVHIDSKNPIVLSNRGTQLYYRESQIDITFGEKVVDGKYNVYIQSAYPGFTPKSLEGVFIDPNTNKDIRNLMKKKHWFTGFSIGISITPGYDIVNGNVGVTVGPSIGYNIYEW